MDMPQQRAGDRIVDHQQIHTKDHTDDPACRACVVLEVATPMEGAR